MSETVKSAGQKENSADNQTAAGPNVNVNSVTPAVVKTRKFRDLFQSPSDSVMSPCSRNLDKSHVPHPSVLGIKQKPKRLEKLENPLLSKVKKA